MRKPTLVQRIDDAIAAHGGPMPTYTLEQVLYPDRRSHTYSSNGGPPGCRMALSAGLRRGGFVVTGPFGHRVVHPRTTPTKGAASDV